MNKLLLKSLFVLMAAGIALAQDETPAPIVTTPASHMQWTMTLDTDSNAAAKPTGWRAVKWDYKKADKLMRIIVTYGDGQTATVEYWHVGTTTMADNAHLHSIDFYADYATAPAYPKACNGFYGIQTVKASDDQGKANFKGEPCHYFRGSTPDTLNALGPAQKGRTNSTITYEAWFDLKTGLPKAFRYQGDTVLFEFSPEIPGDLELPPRFKAAWGNAPM